MQAHIDALAASLHAQTISPSDIEHKVERVRGAHFDMMNEPNVAAVALATSPCRDPAP